MIVTYGSIKIIMEEIVYKIKSYQSCMLLKKRLLPLFTWVNVSHDHGSFSWRYNQGSYSLLDKDTGLVPVMHARGKSDSAKRIFCIGK